MKPDTIDLRTYAGDRNNVRPLPRVAATYVPNNFEVHKIMMFLQMLRPTMTRTTIFFLVAAIIAGGTVRAQEEETTELKPASEMTIVEIMKEAHKAPSRLLKRVADTKKEASDADKKRLFELYKSMAAQDPPKGDMADSEGT